MRRLGDRLGLVLRGAAFVLVLAILLLPVATSLVLSFDARAYIGPMPPSEWSLRWYKSFLTSPQYIDGLGWSLLVCVVAVLLSTAAGVMAALYLHENRFRGRDLMLSVFLSPLVIPQVVVGFGLLITTAALGIGSPFFRLVAAHLIIVMPFTIRLTLVGLDGLRKNVVEAAMTLGARPTAVFWQVKFPLIRPGIVASMIFAASVSMGENAASVFLAGNRLRTLPLALMSDMRNNFNLTIAATSGVLVLVTVAAVVLLDRLVGLERITGRGTYGKF